MNVSSLHSPIPVLTAWAGPWGVSFASNEPLVAATTLLRSISSDDHDGTGAVSGCPESSYDVSSTGAPLGPRTFAVWQSLHPPNETRYLPLSTGVCLPVCCFEQPKCAKPTISMRIDLLTPDIRFPQTRLLP